eukprot:3312452-Amphidinium_carterae.1
MPSRSPPTRPQSAEIGATSPNIAGDLLGLFAYIWGTLLERVDISTVWGIVKLSDIPKWCLLGGCDFAYCMMLTDACEAGSTQKSLHTSNIVQIMTPGLRCQLEKQVSPPPPQWCATPHIGECLLVRRSFMIVQSPFLTLSMLWDWSSCSRWLFCNTCDALIPGQDRLRPFRLLQHRLR